MRLGSPEGRTIPRYHRRLTILAWALEPTVPESNHNLTATTPGESLDLHLREQSTEATDSTLQAHEYRLNQFVC